MPYALRDDLSFCRVDGHLVFIDIRDDRYFRLPDRLERSFDACIDGHANNDIDVLLARNILVPTPDELPIKIAKSQHPVRSAIEESASSEVHFKGVLDVFALVFSIRRQLRSKSLKSVVSAVTAFRQRKQPSQMSLRDGGVDELLCQASTEFRLARAYVPVENICLLDSLAMVKFLARRKLHANIVFGVTSHPFSAHCWVQVEDLVLNDTVGHARAHTPILVV
ncbi:lasso peptide biosynthesis B2 protein [Luteimonas suaedae]|uniref:lasso peptide biosynthesis B2 protein n=1 Tax=Luteimonas suaedae TaxID=2605430 RepID=UPI00165941EA|nr:lasso peptide biosynthesis B2 protein [Luteimonas suaedae]